MPDSVLAVDLGKTSCRAALWVGADRLDAEGVGAPGLAAPHGAEMAESAVLAVALPLLRAAGLDRVGAVGVGAAGALVAPAAAWVLAQRLCGSLGAASVAVASDAVAAHAGALGGGPGVVLAAGTGAVAIAVGRDGSVHRADGLGPWLGDEGGGAWIGLRGLRAALRAAEGRGPATALQAAAEARFGPLSGLAALLEGDANPPRLAAGFAADVASAAAGGDAVAAALLNRAADALARTALAAARPVSGPLPLAATGGRQSPDAGVSGVLPQEPGLLPLAVTGGLELPGGGLSGVLPQEPGRLPLAVTGGLQLPDGGLSGVLPQEPGRLPLAVTGGLELPGGGFSAVLPQELGPLPLAVTGGLQKLGAGFSEALLRALDIGTLQLALAAGTALDGARLLAVRRDTVHEAGIVRCDAAVGRRCGDTVAMPAERLDTLATEGVRPGLDDLDLRPAGDVVRLVLAAERAAQVALAQAEPMLARAAERVAARMLAGGRLFYLGAGTPGRLAVLDAAELGPTYNAPADLVVALLAGGSDALVRSAEGAEDDADAACRALEGYGLRAGDAVVGIAASGRTPYVVGGLRFARALGALTVAVVNNPGSPAAAAAEIAVEILTGPEVVAGSTRMTAGTVQKVALNALSTACMVALGKTYGARMVDVRATNTKLRRRALRMVREITGADEAVAEAALAAAGGRVKPAVVALLAGVDAAEAERRLARTGGRVRAALEGG